jgi:short-subunit dehydrogenase
MSNTGKLLVITGGSKGIGRAVVEKFSNHNFDIVVSARNLSDLQKLKLEVERKFNNQVHVFSGDMAVASEVKAFTDFALSHHKPIDVLVNNAGYYEPGEISTEPEGTLDKMMNANLYSAYNTTRGIVPSMKANKGGHIFNVCSVASFKAYPNGGSYAISKSALLGLSRSLREELKTYNIRVTAVMPGATHTSSWDGSDLPESRFMKPEDIAETIYSAWSLSTRSVVEEIIIRPQLGDI